MFKDAPLASRLLSQSPTLALVSWPTLFICGRPSGIAIDVCQWPYDQTYLFAVSVLTSIKRCERKERVT